MKKLIRIPNVKMYSDYFRCPRCGWQTEGPILVRGDVIAKECENCGFEKLERIK